MKRPAQFILGTAQLGSHYGRTNRAGHLPDIEAMALLEAAYDAGIRTLDTARAYGSSELRIGTFIRAHGLRDLEVLTKLDPLDDVPTNADRRTVESAVERSVEDSLSALSVDHLPVLMVHRVSHLSAFHGAVMVVLRKLQKAGIVGRIGASANTPKELQEVSRHAECQHIQLPYNLLDRRWSTGGISISNRTVHVRSIFLQGLLANPDTAAWPTLPGYSAADLVQKLLEAASRLGRNGPRDLALAFVRGQRWIDGCVLGVEQPAQLAENLALFANSPLTLEQCLDLLTILPAVPDDLVQPWCWPA